MSFWTWLGGGSPLGVTPNATEPPPAPGTVGGTGYTPGDPNGFEFDTTPTYTRALPLPVPSGWDGWPASWDVPAWDFASRFNELVDVAWACLDLNASVLSSMPVFRTADGQAIPPATWMANPDPSIYSSWAEFAKQLFWDFMLGEAFVLPVSSAGGLPLTFRVVPPWMIHVEMAGGRREYRLGGIGGPDVTGEILHIRYKSTTDGAHGVGPLECAGGRMLTAGVLAKYVREVVATGGVPDYTLETDQSLTDVEAQDLLNQWVATRAADLGHPPVLDNNVTLKTHMSMSPKDMAMLEIVEFTESRIAVLLGVQPYLVALAGPANSSVPYANVSQLFDFHDRASLDPKATHVMSALSFWALPVGQTAWLNRDEYTRPPFAERAAAWVSLIAAGAVSIEEFRIAERFTGPAPMVAVTGGDNDPIEEGVSP